ncbi:MAG: TRAP transporter substrate-binding protein DctP, partial [Desulfatiglandales bacterium]|nr:TRAP transporter substrate-binding protein DctP [Desulfatiglandales bacterium]
FPYTPRNAAWKRYVDWGAELKDRTNGGVTIKFVGGTRTIPWQDQIEAMKTGIIDMSWTIPASYKTMVPEAMTFPVSEISTREERKTGIYDIQNKLHHEHGLHLLGRLMAAGFVFYTNKLIKDPKKDFKGLKWGVTGTMWNPVCYALGITPAFVPPPEKYSAMQRGVIDGMGISRTGALALAIHEVAKYRIDHAFLKGGGAVVVMSLKAWKKLGKRLQDQLLAEFIKLEAEMDVLLPKLIKRERGIMIKKGVKMITFSPADAEWYVNIAKEAKWKELEKLIPKYYTQFRKMLTKD